MNAPICIFVFKRVDTTRQMFESLLRCPECKDSELHIYQDEARNDSEADGVDKVRELCETITGFKSIHLHPARMNKGMAASIIDGVTEVLKEHESVIVLEDDIVVAPDFLTFMNEALDAYRDREEIWSISGYTPRLEELASRDPHGVFLVPRAQCWGWATWADRWELTDWEVDDYKRMNHAKQREFNRGGNDLYRTLLMERNGKIESWAIRWAYAAFRNKRLTVNPVSTKTKNIGLGASDSHKGWHDRRHIVELSGVTTVVDPNVQEDAVLEHAFKKHHDLGLVSKVGYFMRLHNLGYHFFKRFFK